MAFFKGVASRLVVRAPLANIAALLARWIEQARGVWCRQMGGWHLQVVLCLMLLVLLFSMAVLLAKVSCVEDSVRGGGGLMQSFNAIEGSEDCLRQRVVGECIKLGIEIRTNAPECGGKDDQVAALRDLVPTGVSGQHTDQGLNAAQMEPLCHWAGEFWAF